jgi:hypothetical protein
VLSRSQTKFVGHSSMVISCGVFLQTVSYGSIESGELAQSNLARGFRKVESLKFKFIRHF